MAARELALNKMNLDAAVNLHQNGCQVQGIKKC
ncbi:MAG: hypothetical protein CM15mV42_0710 [uncultured marine virus]|nr:MAG: hypothetical protein CM15mV42_0710 [uncultured marine virus]